MFLGPFDPPFYELGNFVKILDPPLFRKISQVKLGNFVNFFLPPPLPLLGFFPKFYHVQVLKASLMKFSIFLQPWVIAAKKAMLNIAQ